MTQPPASTRDALLEMLAAVGAPPYRSARLLRAVERAQKALGHTPEPDGDNRTVALDPPITEWVLSDGLKGGSRMADKRSPSVRGTHEALLGHPLAGEFIKATAYNAHGKSTVLLGPCENCDDDRPTPFRSDLQLYLCDPCHAFYLHELGVSGASA